MILNPMETIELNKKTLNTMFSSKQMDWETPNDLFLFLNDIYEFTLDAAASDTNHKCEKYFTKSDNSLIKDWSGNRVWLNPPYGKSILKWIKKVYNESDKCDVIVCLLPSRTGTEWFQYCMKYAEIIFIRGRLKFKYSGICNSAPFDSLIAVFGKESNKGVVRTLDINFKSKEEIVKGLW